MEAATRPRIHAAQTQAWVTVKRWDDLRGEPKLAWLYLWERAGCKPATIAVHPAAVGEDQGKAQADKAGRQALSRLAAFGLIVILDRGPQWTVHVQDPEVVKRGRLIQADPQQEFFPDDAPPVPEPEEQASLPFFSPVTAHVDQHVPSQGTGKGDICAQIEGVKDRDPLPVTAHVDQHVPSTEGPLERKSRLKREQDAARQEAERIPTIADVTPQVLQRCRERALTEEARCELIAARIWQAVAEPSLPRWVCREVTVHHPASKLGQGVPAR